MLNAYDSRVFRLTAVTMRHGMSFLTAVLLAFYVGYIPYHLAVEEHIAGSLPLAESAHHDSHEDTDHDSDHAPHASADHSFDIILKPKFSLDVICGLISNLAFSFEPMTHAVIISSEPFQIPKEFPPDPLQPRAPPAV